MTILISLAQTDADVEAARTLFREYAGSLPFELDFQGFEDEVASLPGVPRFVKGTSWRLMTALP